MPARENSRRLAINCDMGESFGLYKMGDDEGMMPYITIANVACGFHASDPTVMARTVRAITVGSEAWKPQATLAMVM